MASPSSNRFSGGIDTVQPGLDTVQEFRIETNGSSARYARPATVTLATKSGTNQLHGSLFETFRNNAAGLRARARQDGNTSAALIRNEFGASAGGPVYLPKIYDGRNRTFWFFATKVCASVKNHLMKIMFRLHRCSPATSARFLDQQQCPDAHLRSTLDQRRGDSHAVYRRPGSSEPHQLLLRRDAVDHPYAHQRGQSLSGPESRRLLPE